MTRNDLIKLIGGKDRTADYLPVAMLLKSGYACAGHFNATMNADFEDLIILVNAQLIELNPEPTRTRPVVHDFSEFLSEMMTTGFEFANSDFGKPVPIAAIPVNEIAVVYPVAQIETLIRRTKEHAPTAASGKFLDLGKSEVLAVLRTKLW